MVLKKILFVLALCFLLSWAYREKIKPFIQSEFGLSKTDSILPAPKTGAGTFNPPHDSLYHIRHRPPVPGMNSGKYVYGLDISHYEGNEANILQRKKDSILFVICKATQGISIKDSAFDRNWRVIKEKAFIRGVYHFYQCGDDPVKQAAYFLSVVGNIAPDDFPPMIDIEEDSFKGNCPAGEIQKNILTFLGEIERRTGRRPVVYTDNNAGRHLKDTFFARYPLWIAYYEKKGPLLPGPWKKKGWAMWQKSESYQLDGFSDDYDTFNGGRDALTQFIIIH